MKKELKSYFRREGEGVSLIPYFSTDKTLGTGYDMHFLCAMIADHVTLLAIFLLNFWAAGCSSEGGNFAKKIIISLFYFQILAICWCLSLS